MDHGAAAPDDGLIGALQSVLPAPRIYALKQTDPDRPPANSLTDPPASQKNDRIWGYEKPAIVEQRVFNNWKVFPNCDQSAYSLLLTESDRGRVCGIYVLCGCPREIERG